MLYMTYQFLVCYLLNSNVIIALYCHIVYNPYYLTCHQTFVGQFITEYDVSFQNMPAYVCQSRSILLFYHGMSVCIFLE